MEKAGNPCAGLLYGKFVCDMTDQPAADQDDIMAARESGVGYFTYTDAISYMGLHRMGKLLADRGNGRWAAGPCGRR